MDSQTKSAIKSLVLDLRHSLEAELEIALKRYGVFTDRKWSLESPPERLADEADRQVWKRITTVIRQSLQERRTLPQASQDYIRESAFTFLNRLVGLKCLEARGIIDEVITTRQIYGGRSKFHRDYRDDHPHEARAADDALPACLAEACRRVDRELIGYLFDPDDDYSLVWPRYPVLKGCIEKINALEEPAWKEDEIIGWIYQFYNAEEKVAVRKRGKPKTPHDVAVINQFFTPRWVVKFLVDNTLGRLWLEMHPDSPRVRTKCDYLVPEPLPVEEGEQDPENRFILDPDSPLNNPQAEPRREPKPVTQLKLLDPACGTMHFGHYAMEVFEAIYRDAREWGEVQIDDARIPSAILEYNLFGVDIDRRAVQLAALSLFMKARTMRPQARVRQVNLVVADATLPDSGIKRKFLERYTHDKVVQRAFAQVLDDMDQVSQVGSLLRVEERLKALLAKAGHAAVAGDWDTQRQRALPGFEPPARQMRLAELLPEEQAASLTPHLTLQELRDDLRAFARQALDEHDINAQLFATEADKAVRLLDVLMGEYAVVVMNPPYGNTTQFAKGYLKQTFPHTQNDLYAAFIERAIELLRSNGYVGTLVSRTFFYLSSFRSLREEVLINDKVIRTSIDLGGGVLDDAAVETTATVIELSKQTTDIGVFFKLDEVDDQELSYREILANDLSGCFIASMNEFHRLPASPIAYWVPKGIRNLFEKEKRLQPTFAMTKVGLQTGSDELFVHYFWEVNPLNMGNGKRWQPFAKGGSYCRYYLDFNLVVDWENNGDRIKHFADPSGKIRSRPQNEDYYFHDGITYINISSIAFSAQQLPSGIIFSVQGQGLFPKDKYNRWVILAILNSNLLNYILNVINPGRHYQAGHVANVPMVYPDQNREKSLVSNSKMIHEIKRHWDTGNEICTRFTLPWILQLTQAFSLQNDNGIKSLLLILGDAETFLSDTPDHVIEFEDLVSFLHMTEKALDEHLSKLQKKIDDIVYSLFGASSTDRPIVEGMNRDRPPETVWSIMENKTKSEKGSEHVRRFFSYFVLQALRIDPDGIIPIVGSSGQEAHLIDRVRIQIEEQFDAETAYHFEQDSAKYLGRPLEDWLQRYFFYPFHVKLYKNRPILWQLTSPKGHFAVMLDYHRLNRDTLPKVQSLYLWPQMEAVRTRLNAARQNDAPAKRIADLEDEMEDLKDCNQRLDAVIQGTVKVDLPEWANGPYREGKPPYDPDIDDGVRVNLLPIQEAGLLPAKKVV
ncbi:MAG: BREX-1 system adenine-specific DNA-methyltransferase PglX [Anaerolineales bacterium]|nr:BREX-1 system adenine-specific DNA-methyltransferase PglX [Anaerolineales bacterium]